MAKREIIHGVPFRLATPKEMREIKEYIKKWDKQPSKRKTKGKK